MKNNTRVLCTIMLPVQVDVLDAINKGLERVFGEITTGRCGDGSDQLVLEAVGLEGES